MIVNVVTVQVKPGHLEDFLAATVENHQGSRTEPGNLRFDVLQSLDDPCRILLYEVFASEEAVEAHRRTDHYLRWQVKVADWMAGPRQRASHRIVAPTDPAAW